MPKHIWNHAFGITACALVVGGGACAGERAPTEVVCPGAANLPILVILSDAQTGARWPFYNVTTRSTRNGLTRSYQADSITGMNALWSTSLVPPDSGVSKLSTSIYLVAGDRGDPGTYAVEVTADGYRPWRTAAFNTPRNATCMAFMDTLNVQLTKQ